MKTQPMHEYLIPDKDSKFNLLPDGKEVTFHDLGELGNYVQNEIAAWTNVANTIANKFKLVWDKIEEVSKDAKEGCIEIGALTEVKDLLCKWTVNTNGINSCIDSNSRLGRYIKGLRDAGLNNPAFRDYSLVAICVLGYPCPSLTFSLNHVQMSLAAAKVAKHFACPEDLSERVSEYQKRLEDLTNSADAQNKDYESRMSRYEKDVQDFSQRREAELSKEESEYAERLDKANEKIASLEEAYSKKLQLEGPAQYWKSISRFYLWWGWGLLVLSLVLGGVTTKGLLRLLSNSETITVLNETKINLSTIRASLILMAITSIAGYLIHIFVKLAISCFHLSRDYRERFQLTNVFLALLRDGDVKCDDQVNQIVMQALFSRSDTGLLKGEHALKMPGVVDILKGSDE